MDIAGLSLTVLDQAFKLAQLLHQIISDERNFGDDANKMRIRMDDEQLRLRALQQLLFNKSHLISHPGGRLFDEFEAEWQFTILEMLRDLRRQLSKYIPVEIEYRLTRPLDVLDPTMPSIDALIHEFEGYNVAERDIQKRTSPFLKWKFALKDKKKAEKIIEEFENWNNRIQRNLELIVLRTKILGNPAGLKTLQHDRDAISLGLSQNAKLQEILRNSDTVRNMQVDQNDIILDKRKVSYLDVAVWKGKSTRTLVEYQKFSPVQGNAAQADVRSINQLAALLNEANRTEFRTFTSGGFFTKSSENEFAICFNIPKDVDAFSLYSLATAYTTRKPALGERFRLCHTLASAISAFHVVGWLHKSFRSDVILFFNAQEPNSARSALSRPFIFGFEYSRPASKISTGFYDDIPERNIYRHPLRQGRPEAPFKRIHDIYALGVVLLEIGLWTPAWKLVGKLSQGGIPEDIARRLSWHADHNLPIQVGDKFRDVTHRCLSGDFDVEKDDENETELQKAFSKHVIEVLGTAVASL